MIYSDYARRKMHNVVKLDTKEGYPLTVYNCANKNLKDYSITGNTGGVGDKTENLFNYTEPVDGAANIADEYGWFDVTIDNTKGTTSLYTGCSTKINLDLNPNTSYYLVLEVAERTGNITVRPCNNYDGSSQFNTFLKYDSPNVGIKPPQKIVSKSTFADESIKFMLQTLIECLPGKSGRVKFRIAVYETEKNYMFISIIGGVTAYFLGGLTMAIQALLIFMAIDYITGFMVAFVFQKSPKSESGGYNSKAGFKGLCKKAAILLLVGVAHRLDLVIGVDFIKDSVICGYCANELISIIENLGLMGVYVPPVIKKGIDILQKKEDCESAED